MGAASLSVPQQQVQLDAPGMLAETDEYMAGGKRPARVYRVVNGIAVLPVTGTLVHRLGGMRPFSGMTGYDGIVACLQQAMADSQCGAYCWTLTVRAGRPPARLTALT